MRGSFLQAGRSQLGLGTRGTAGDRARGEAYHEDCRNKRHRLEHFGSLRVASEEGNGIVATMFSFNKHEILTLAILLVPVAAVAVWMTLLAVNLFT